MHAGMVGVIVRSSKDTRPGEFASHDGITSRARIVVGDSLLCDDVQLAVAEAGVVGIDEGQFFEDLVPATEAWAAAGKYVIVAGLDGNANGHPFGHICDLLPRAEECTKLLAVCSQCGADAPFTILLRGTLEDGSVLVGGAETYMPVCRACRDAHMHTPRAR